MSLLVVFIRFFLFCCYLFFLESNSIIAHSINNNTVISNEYKKAMEYLDSIQDDCSHTKIAIVDIGCNKGCGGGFASQFQLAAMKWMRVFSLQHYQIPVLVRGKLKGYSDDIPECDHVADNSWTCYFQPSSKCEKKWLAEKVTIVPSSMNMMDDLVPPEFAHMSVSWWWGVVQHRMFRLQERVDKIIISRMASMDNGRGFPSTNTSIIGLHVRHGDKSNDGWKLQSLEDEMKMARLSPDCHLARSNHTRHLKSIHKGVCLSEEEADANTSESNNNEDPTNANDAPSVSGLLDDKVYVFVASDDPAVLAVSQGLGHLVDESGVSQQTGTDGMEKYLFNHRSSRFNATLEIIQDIYLLSRCSTLVGMAASQVFRMAVGLSQATGALNYAVASDFSELPNIIRMSWWLRLIVPEPFHSPDGTKINQFR